MANAGTVKANVRVLKVDQASGVSRTALERDFGIRLVNEERSDKVRMNQMLISQLFVPCHLALRVFEEWVQNRNYCHRRSYR